MIPSDYEVAYEQAPEWGFGRKRTFGEQSEASVAWGGKKSAGACNLLTGFLVRNILRKEISASEARAWPGGEPVNSLMPPIRQLSLTCDASVSEVKTETTGTPSPSGELSNFLQKWQMRSSSRGISSFREKILTCARSNEISIHTTQFFDRSNELARKQRSASSFCF